MTAGWMLPASFVDAWIPEFVKSVVMVTGTAVSIERRSSGAESPADLVWHEQPFERQESGRVWIGVSLQAAVRLFGEAAENETAGAALFRELIGQSLKATAEVLNTSSHPGLKCPDSAATEAPPVESATLVLWVAGAGDAPTPVWLHCDRTFAELLHTTEAGSRQASPTATLPGAAPQAPAPDSLHGIDLPVVVVLGRATLRIADVLKLTVGSIVELDTRVGEPVDVCIQGVVVARGEVVSIRGNYGVRIVEVIRRNRLHVQTVSRAQLPQPALVEAAAR